MSVVCSVAAAGTITVSAQVLMALCGGVAASMGLRTLTRAEGEVEREEIRAVFEREARTAQEALEQVEVSVATQGALEQIVAERCTATFGSEGLLITITRDIRGELTVRARGEGLSRADVAERAERFLGLLRQQVAYREVVGSLKHHGLEVQEEAREADGVVRVRLRKPRA